MLDIFLNNIDKNNTINDATPDDQENADAFLCENELYQHLLGNEFNMKMRNTETLAYNCPLSYWKSSAHIFKHLEGLAGKYLAIPATSVPSERI